MVLCLENDLEGPIFPIEEADSYFLRNIGGWIDEDQHIHQSANQSIDNPFTICFLFYFILFILLPHSWHR